MAGTTLTRGRPYFDKDTTDMIKGVGIIMMFCHHILTYQGWYIDGIYFPEMEDFCTFMAFPTKICVAIFAFLNGYLYAFNNKSRIRYSLSKILSLYSVYWIVYLILLIPALIWSGYRPGITDIIRDLAALPNDVVRFGWYVFYFAVIMILLPLLKPLLDKNIWLAIGLSAVIITIMYSVNATVATGFTEEMIYYFGWWTPVTLSGYIVGRYGLFEKIDGSVMSKIKSPVIKFVLSFALLILCFFGRVFFRHFEFAIGDLKICIFLCVDTVLVPLFIFSIVTLRNVIKVPGADLVLRDAGKYSLYMWLIHSAFFGISSGIFQKVLWLPHFPVLAFLWALILCYGLARILEIPSRHINAKIKKMV
ncbi:MAG: acyltransferase [Clostridiales bacterium]|nr:acyltransferase [Clostridiales bacterium]